MDKIIRVLINEFENEIKNLEDISEMITWHSSDDTLNDIGDILGRKIILHDAKLKSLLLKLKDLSDKI